MGKKMTWRVFLKMNIGIRYQIKSVVVDVINAQTFKIYEAVLDTCLAKSNYEYEYFFVFCIYV